MNLADPQTIVLIMALIGAGVLAGYTSGLFGIGGGVVLVPAFVTILPYFKTAEHVQMHMAVGTCLALIVPGAILAARKQYQMGKLDVGLLRFWIQAVLVGVVAGVILIKFVSTDELKIFFAAYLGVAALYAIFRKATPPGEECLPKKIVMRIVGFIVGSVSVLLGIGGGTITVPFFKFSHYPLKKAIALSTATSLFIGFGGAVGTIIDGWGVFGRTPYSFGFVSLPGFILITPLMMIFAPLGVRTANAIPEPTLRKIYAGFLTLMTGYMVFKIV